MYYIGLITLISFFFGTLLVGMSCSHCSLSLVLPLPPFIFGMAFYLSVTGFEPEEMKFNKETWTWEPEGVTHFSWLVVAGVTMLGIYVVPIVMRPLDFLENFRGYVIGLISYLLLIPMYSNVF